MLVTTCVVQTNNLKGKGYHRCQNWGNATMTHVYSLYMCRHEASWWTWPWCVRKLMQDTLDVFIGNIMFAYWRDSLKFFFRCFSCVWGTLLGLEVWWDQQSGLEGWRRWWCCMKLWSSCTDPLATGVCLGSLAGHDVTVKNWEGSMVLSVAVIGLLLRPRSC